VEAGVTVARQPGRTLLCAIGTVVAVAAFTATNGLTETANNAVSSSFDALRATTVEFQGPASLTETDAERVAELRGVTSAGLLWDVDQQQPLPVTNGFSSAGPVHAALSVTAVSPPALTTIGARLASGRFYDWGAGRDRQMVALLGAAAAAQLGIESARDGPAIDVDGVILTVVGIVSNSQEEAQVVLGVIVPPYVARVLAEGGGQRRVIARTAPGAAQLIGREGPTTLDPYNPRRVVAEVPPDPTSLRAQVQASLSTLLTVLSLTGLGIGLLSICAVTIMSVAQRRAEIGLRRALGYGRLDIARLIVLEAAGVGALGGLLGTALGVLATSAIASTNHWTPVMNMNLVLAAPFVGIGVGVVAGSYPAARAAFITPMAALRS